MVVIKIMNEFLHSPIWTYEDDFITDDLPMIAEDGTLQQISKQIEELYSSYYEFDSHEQPCWFNHEKEKADKSIMLRLITKLIARLNELNDGSYIIEDCETSRIKKL
ncbi:RNA helicase [Phascolarctobacterium sp.]|uniref:RNA helicase n=1 Tax=Phascolarctobacterium sp. TaxID=2049039 RepID=UPI00386DA166